MRFSNRSHALPRIAFVLATTIGLALVGIAPATAQTPGGFTGAEVLAPGMHQFGGFLDVSSNIVGLTAQLRMSFYPGVDFGFAGGPARIDAGSTTKGVVRLGADIKVAAHHADARNPFDLALGGELGVETGDNYSVLGLGPSATVSYSYRTGPGVAPYGGATLLFSNVDVGSHSETNFSVPLRVGAEITVSPAARLVVEYRYRAGDKFRDRSVFGVGVHLPF